MADTTGPLKGVPYDGWMTKADGKGKWWEGYDPRIYTGSLIKDSKQGAYSGPFPGDDGDQPDSLFKQFL